MQTLPPQAVTRNELYGYLHPATREWKEGLMSVTFRDMANNKINKHQWIVLDGDIDAEWIESMNTVGAQGSFPPWCVCMRQQPNSQYGDHVQRGHLLILGEASVLSHNDEKD